jgi:hypothetical protein
VFYVIRRQVDLQRAHDSVTICLATLEILPIQRSTLELARTLKGNDFEDKLQLACATEARLDAIVTRDPGGFTGAALHVYTPVELLGHLPANP